MLYKIYTYVPLTLGTILPDFITWSCDLNYKGKNEYRPNWRLAHNKYDRLCRSDESALQTTDDLLIVL